MEVIMGVGGDQVRGPNLVGGQDSLCATDDIPGCVLLVMGGGGQDGAYFGIGVSHLVEFMPYPPPPLRMHGLV